jgi:RimJ/RimL family protein N-acetyltransferase
VVRVCKGLRVILSPIDTDRLVLTPLRVDHAREMVTVLADPSLYEFTGGEPPTLADLEHRYRTQTAPRSSSDESWCNWIVSSKSSGCAVGFVQATVAGRSADLAWVIGVADQGHGFASEATDAVRRWLSGQGVRRFEAHIHPRHVASQAVATRVGLRRTGADDDDGEEIWAAEHAPCRAGSHLCSLG